LFSAGITEIDVIHPGELPDPEPLDDSDVPSMPS